MTVYAVIMCLHMLSGPADGTSICQPISEMFGSSQECERRAEMMTRTVGGRTSDGHFKEIRCASNGWR